MRQEGKTQSKNALLLLAQALKKEGYCFTSVTPATHARVNQREGNEWARNFNDVFGWSRPFRADLLPGSLFELMREADVVIRHGEGWRSLIRFSSLQEELFVHSAYPTTDQNAVFFGPDTYRFATAINNYLAQHGGPIKRAADIGCGAGPGAIAVALRLPEAEVLALDINDAALRLTEVNMALADVVNVIPRHSNLLSSVDGYFDLIVANPPYLLDRSERAYRHGGGERGEGLSIQIAKEAINRLAHNGSLLLYTGVAIVDGVDLFQNAMSDLFDNEHFKWNYCEIDPDVFGEELLEPEYAMADRIAAVVVTATKVG